jgi:hypothetical protein
MTMAAPGEQFKSMISPQKQEYFVGTVEDNKDPDKIGRLKIRVVELYGSIPTSHIPWANPSSPFGGGNDYGFFMIPPVGAKVRIALWRGHPWFPEWYGTHWFRGEAPFEAALIPPNNFVIKTPEGHLIDLHDGGPHIRIKDKDGDYIILDTRKRELKIFAHSSKFEQEGGSVHHSIGGSKNEEMSGSWSVFISGDVHIQAGGAVNIDAAGGIYLNSGKANPTSPTLPQDVEPLQESST